MAPQVLPRLQVFVHQQLNVVFRVVGQAHDGRRTRCTVEVFFHVFRRRKAQTGNAQLTGKLFGLERLVARHHQQVEVRLLPVAEEQVLTDHRAQNSVDVLAGFHGVGVHPCMVGAPELDAEAVQQVVSADFFFNPPGAVRRTALI